MPHSHDIVIVSSSSRSVIASFSTGLLFFVWRRSFGISYLPLATPNQNSFLLGCEFTKEGGTRLHAASLLNNRRIHTEIFDDGHDHSIQYTEIVSRTVGR
mmetsp:Transcript_3074/g.5816  ORF Transcript_3074/g.5816 Transcript_3074/m.5816 type:complete len:100 (+) Transcript_3074:1248-1547(+)